MRLFFLIVAALGSTSVVAAEQIVLLPVIAKGKRADWRSAGRIEAQLANRYASDSAVVSSAVAATVYPHLGRDTMACRAGASCLTSLLGKTSYTYGFYVQIHGKGRRAKLTLSALSTKGLIETWSGSWKGVDEQIDRIMGKMLSRLVVTKVQPIIETVAPPMEMAVMDLENKGGFADAEISLVQGNIMALLQRSERFQSLVGGADLRAMMDFEQQKDVLGCGDSSCLAEIGSALGVPYLMTMSLGRFAAQRVLNLSLLHVDEGKVLHRVSRIFAADRMLLAQLPGLVEELLQGAYGRGGIKLLDDAAQIAAAKQAQLASGARAHHQKPLVWLGSALVAGAGLGAYIMPDNAQLRTLRDDYDSAGTSKTENRWSDFNAAVNQRRNLGLAVPSMLGLGGATLLWGLLSR